MAKRDNPRYKTENPKKGKNSRAAHSLNGSSLTYERGTGARGDRPAKPAKAAGSTRSSRAYGDAKGKAAARPQRDSEEAFEPNPNLLIGRNPVMEAIKSGRTIDKILMQKDGEGSIKKIAAMARDEGLQIQYVDKIVLDKLAPGKAHQGIAAYAAATTMRTWRTYLRLQRKRVKTPFWCFWTGLRIPTTLGPS